MTVESVEVVGASRQGALIPGNLRHIGVEQVTGKAHRENLYLFFHKKTVRMNFFLKEKIHTVGAGVVGAGKQTAL